MLHKDKKPPLIHQKELLTATKVAPAFAFLDTLAQPRKVAPKPPKTLERSNLTKRARSKFVSNKITLALADLDSPLKKSYWNTYYCNSVLQQHGKKITAKYCNNRWCSTCNRIRTAKLIIGYTQPLAELKEKYFVTLTLPNVKHPGLEVMIDDMGSEFGRIKDALRKRKMQIIGIRKLECTYNFVRDDYHPHFHLIVDGEEVANEIVNEWLKRYPEANRSAQDVRAADDNSVHELFKYFTKIATYSNVTKKRQIHIRALDNIFCAMRGKRVFQPMGIKKDISEDIDELQSAEYDIEENITSWTWQPEFHDWVDIQTGEVLTNFKPPESVISLLENIITTP